MQPKTFNNSAKNQLSKLHRTCIEEIDYKKACERKLIHISQDGLLDVSDKHQVRYHILLDWNNRQLSSLKFRDEYLLFAKRWKGFIK